MTAGQRRKAITCLLCQDNHTVNRDGVCEPCKNDWQRGRAFRALAKAGGDEEREIIYSVDYWYIYAFAGEAQPMRRHDLTTTLQKVLLQLAEAEDLESHNWRSGYAAPEPESRDVIIGWTKNCRTDYHRSKYVARRGSGELLRIAYRCIVDLLAEAYADGARKGQSMLHGLATGERTVQDFNEWFTGIEDKKK